VLTIPPKLLAKVGGKSVAALVPDELVQLEGAGLSALIYPSDIALLGEKSILARGRAAILARLTVTEAYLTSAEETQKVEDRLAEISRGSSAAATPGAFRQIDEDLASLTVPADDWETLYRLRLQVENQKRIPGASEPGTGAPEEGRGGPPPTRSEPPAGGVLDRVLAIGTLTLLAADVLVWLGDRRRR
jgi:hypothetical protein